MRKIEVPIDTPADFNTAADTQREREEEAREREEEAQTQWEERQRRKGMREETTHSAEEGVAEKHARTDNSDKEMDTEGGGETHDKHLPDRLR